MLLCSMVGLVIIGKEDARVDIRKSSGGRLPMTKVREVVGKERSRSGAVGK